MKTVRTIIGHLRLLSRLSVRRLSMLLRGAGGKQPTSTLKP
jgi:hypothetical protein